MRERYVQDLRTFVWSWRRLQENTRRRTSQRSKIQVHLGRPKLKSVKVAIVALGVPPRVDVVPE